jgi:glucose/arabinose dehydrogenase
MNPTSRLALAAIALGLAACGSRAAPVPTGTPPPPASSPTAASPAATLTSLPATPTVAIPTQTLPPQVNSNPQQVVLASNLDDPDDLALAPDGSIYFSDAQDGTVTRLTTDGQLLTVVSGLNVPEGIVLLPNGLLIVAEQGWNRLDQYDPVTNRLTWFVRLVNETTREGVDGIALDNHDPSTVTVIIPDSPNGTLLRASLDGQKVTLIAKGLGRPTGAWTEADGSILVTDENANALLRIHPDGTTEKIVGLPVPDDVVEDQAGNIFVCTLGDGAVHWISAASGEDAILAKGFINPQGIILDPQGDLVVTDPGHHQLVKLLIH